MDISGASAVITGGASGLGAAAALRLARDGVKVVLVDLQDDLGDAVADQVNGAYVRADVTEADQVAELKRLPSSY